MWERGRDLKESWEVPSSSALILTSSAELKSLEAQQLTHMAPAHGHSGQPHTGSY